MELSNLRRVWVGLLLFFVLGFSSESQAVDLLAKKLGETYSAITGEDILDFHTMTNSPRLLYSQLQAIMGRLLEAQRNHRRSRDQTYAAHLTTAFSKLAESIPGFIGFVTGFSAVEDYIQVRRRYPDLQQELYESEQGAFHIALIRIMGGWPRIGLESVKKTLMAYASGKHEALTKEAIQARAQLGDFDVDDLSYFVPMVRILIKDYGPGSQLNGFLARPQNHYAAAYLSTLAEYLRREQDAGPILVDELKAFEAEPRARDLGEDLIVRVGRLSQPRGCVPQGSFVSDPLSTGL